MNRDMLDVLDDLSEALDELWRAWAREHEEHPDEYLRGKLNAINAIKMAVSSVACAMKPPENIWEWVALFTEFEGAT